MSIQKVNHSVWRAIDAQALDATGGSAPSKTSLWYDVSGWTDKRISYVATGASTDFDIIMHISPYGYYELRELVTAGTDSTKYYEAVTIVTAHGAQIMASKDADDVDELQRPIRSMRIYVDNDSAVAITAFNVWIEGWS